MMPVSEAVAFYSKVCQNIVTRDRNRVTATGFLLFSEIGNGSHLNTD